MQHHSIRRGLDIPIAGAASGAVVQLDAPEIVALDPRELRGFVPRLAAREGDVVQAGQPLFFHKFDPRVQVVSPVAGKVREIRRARRRVITDVVVEVGQGDTVTHRAWDLASLKGIDRETARAQLLDGGAWPLLRTRPMDRVPSPDVVPQAILISGYETGPLMPGPEVLLGEADREALQAAVYALQALTDGPVYLTHAQGEAPPALRGLEGVEVHTFSGPHPAGDPGVQLNHIAPPSSGGQVFYLRAWDAAVLGRLFLTGQLDPQRIYAAVGTGVRQPRYVRTVVGAPVAHVAGPVAEGDLRWIRGSVLTGERVDAAGFAGWYPRAIHVLPDVVHRELLGWATPQVGRWSFHRAYPMAWRKPSQPIDLRPGLFGGHRAIVPIEAYDQVIATPDILPIFLFKSIIAGDLENAIRLGLLDITQEEAALVSFICPSKNDYDVILREGLELYAKEA